MKHPKDYFSHEATLTYESILQLCLSLATRYWSHHLPLDCMRSNDPFASQKFNSQKYSFGWRKQLNSTWKMSEVWSRDWYVSTQLYLPPRLIGLALRPRSSRSWPHKNDHIEHISWITLWYLLVLLTVETIAHLLHHCCMRLNWRALSKG